MTNIISAHNLLATTIHMAVCLQKAESFSQFLKRTECEHEKSHHEIFKQEAKYQGAYLLLVLLSWKNILPHGQISFFATTFMLSHNLSNNDSLWTLVPVLRVKIRWSKVLWLNKRINSRKENNPQNMIWAPFSLITLTIKLKVIKQKYTLHKYMCFGKSPSLNSCQE